VSFLVEVSRAGNERAIKWYPSGEVRGSAGRTVSGIPRANSLWPAV
jgi:hypothetical protein